METDKRIERLSSCLLQWYELNARKLPWREDKDPYHIWLSEIMLQQTRIEAVKGYYNRFLEALPTIHDLAIIEEEKLLKLWQGLGYYNRARNLKKAAQKIEDEFQGKMPESYEELLSLPGLGEYTAGAIASIAYEERVPAVDGNVLRVISRILGSKKDILLGSTKKEMTQFLKQVMPKQAGDFNQGLMELGETICTPKGKPLCEECPLKTYCIAYEKDLTQEIPVRENKITRKKEQKTVLILVKGEEISIRKRQNNGLLAGMYEFPHVDGMLKGAEIKEQLKNWGYQVDHIESIGKHKHIFSHIEWEMAAYQIAVANKTDEFVWVKAEELEKVYPIPGAFQVFEKKIKTDPNE